MLFLFLKNQIHIEKTYWRNFWVLFWLEDNSCSGQLPESRKMRMFVIVMKATEETQARET